MRIWFDMDGTIADLYGVDGWLAYIMNRDTKPYEIAEGIGNLTEIAEALNKVQNNGHEIGIISWTAKGAPAEYNEAVANAKREWLHKNFPTVTWNTIKVVAYGTNKRTATGGGILFDDEEPNRKIWGKGAYEPHNILKVLNEMA